MDINSIGRSVQPLAAASVAPVEHTAEHHEIVQAVKALNATEMFGQENELLFQMDHQARRVVIKVINRNTREVLCQVPPEYVLRLAEDLHTSE